MLSKLVNTYLKPICQIQTNIIIDQTKSFVTHHLLMVKVIVFFVFVFYTLDYFNPLVPSRLPRSGDRGLFLAKAWDSPVIQMPDASCSK